MFLDFERRFTRWARQYGDIFSLKIGSGTVVVITSAEAVYEIMDKNSAITSDRPPMYFVDQVTGGHNLVLLVRIFKIYLTFMNNRVIPN